MIIGTMKVTFYDENEKEDKRIGFNENIKHVVYEDQNDLYNQLLKPMIEEIQAEESECRSNTLRINANRYTKETRYELIRFVRDNENEPWRHYQKIFVIVKTEG